jgi:hypothetical protein
MSDLPVGGFITGVQTARCRVATVLAAETVDIVASFRWCPPPTGYPSQSGDLHNGKTAIREGWPGNG